MGTDHLDGDPSPAALALYSDMPPENSTASWSEPAATRIEEFKIALPAQLRDPAVSDAAAAVEMAQFKDGLLEAGLGPTTASELFDHAMAQAKTGKAFTGTYEDGLAELRQVWGNKTAAKLKAVAEVINVVERRWPVRAFLRNSGLANDPSFVRKVAARAARISKPNV